MTGLSKFVRTFAMAAAGCVAIPGQYIRAVSLEDAKRQAAAANVEVVANVFAETDEHGEISVVFHPIALLPSNEAERQLEALFERDLVVN